MLPPVYNFVHPTSPPSSRGQRRPRQESSSRKCLSMQDVDTIIAPILERWALRLHDDSKEGGADESDNSTRGKVTRLWQALLRYSSTNPRSTPREQPNAACTAIFMEILVELLRIVLPPTSLVGTLLVGGLVHSIYQSYDNNKTFYANALYADKVYAAPDRRCSFKQRQEEKQKQLKEVGVETNNVSIDVICQLFDQLESPPSLPLLPRRSSTTLPSAPRVQCLIQCINKLPVDAKQQLAATLRSSSACIFGSPLVEKIDEDREAASSASGGGTLQTFPKPPPTSISSLSLIKKRTSHARASFLKKPVEMPSRRRLASRMPSSSLRGRLQPQQSANLDEIDPSELIDELDEIYQLVCSRDVRMYHRGVRDFKQLLHKCHGDGGGDFFDDDPGDPRQSGSKNESNNDKDGVQAVATLVQLMEWHPDALASAIQQAPHILIDVLTTHPGILKYAMVHCPNTVEIFMQLDEAAAQAWQSVVHAAHKHTLLPLLWSSNETTLEDIVPARLVHAPSASPLQVAFQWLDSHVHDVVRVLLLNHDLAKRIFLAMESSPSHNHEDSTLHRQRLDVLVQMLDDLPAFLDKTQRAQEAGMALALRHDIKGVVALLHGVLTHQGHLQELVASSVEVATALAMHNKQALRNLLQADVATWKPFFVHMVAEHPFLLVDSLITSTKHLPGGAELLAAYRCVMDGDTGHWLRNDDDDDVNGGKASSSSSGKARNHFSRAISVLRLTHGLRSSSARSNTLASVAETAMASSSSSMNSPSKSSTRRHIDSRFPRPAASSAVVVGIYHTPWIWKTFLVDADRTQKQNPVAITPWTRRELKRFMLDMLIEKIKRDQLDYEEDDRDVGGATDLSVFVCDSLMTKFQNRSLVASHLDQLVRGMQAHIDDRRVSFFAAACGVQAPLRRGILHAWLGSLAHLLFGVLRIFEPKKRLQQLVDGSCVVPVSAVIAAAHSIFAKTLASDEMDTLVDAISNLHRFRPSDSADDQDLSAVDLDAAMDIFLHEWQDLDAQMDEQFVVAFHRFRRANQQVIGMGQFVKIITSVTRHRVSVRNCRLIFYDTGKDMMDLDTLLHLTQAYDLRAALVHPKVELDDADLAQVRASIGISNVLSFEDEFQQLRACWQEIKPIVDKQLTAVHQTDETKQELKERSQAVQEALAYLESGMDHSPCMATAWETFRHSIATLQAAVHAERSLSMVYVQCHVRKWVSKLQKRHKSQVKSTSRVTSQ
ncbi:hypothetical protein AeMF1_001777 [Aphanomyces euteiches]|nr:hypothetical protein AeMF1_001777 [Aphanomyces euteiches]